MQVAVTYLFHSGFCVTLPDRYLVFDYFMDTVDAGQKRHLSTGVISPSMFELKPATVFVSHAHEDHYNPVVLKWQADGRKVNYVFSDDIPSRIEGVHRISAGQTIQVDDMVVKAYPSTDRGVCFVVEVSGMKIFHAGDFNFWHWKNDVGATQVAYARKAFLDIMNQLQDQSFDIAFFPVDARMGEGFSLGAEYFVKATKPKYFFPMHFSMHPQESIAFAEELDVAGVKTLMPQKRGDTFSITL